jgi:hypothetical protein
MFFNGSKKNTVAVNIIRCGFCVSHEVDSHYCPNCAENMPSAEARLKKNRQVGTVSAPSSLWAMK